MGDYNNLLKSHIDQLNEYSKKWRVKLENRSPVASYNTTKSVQIKTVSSPEKHAELIDVRCEAIQKVINNYKRQVDRMYPKGRLALTPKHYRSEEMEKLFKDAYSDRQKVADKLRGLRNDKKNIEEAIRETEAKLENLKLDETTGKNELFKAQNRLEKKESKLETTQKRIDRTEGEYEQAKLTYRKRATEIYQQCRKLEDERLDQIRKTLIAFSRAIHTTEYSNGQNEMYNSLVSAIQSEQNIRDDLDFWAKEYHVTGLPQRALSETGENEEYYSATDQTPIAQTPTAQPKRRLTLKRSNTNEPKTPQ